MEAQSVTPGRTYLLAMMTAIYVVNYLDRQILNIALPQIKAEFALSDTQLGLLSGPVFGVVYAVMGLPLAAITDRVNRRNLVAITLALFSCATVLSSYAANVGQLLAARFCTGVGEAGTSPAAVAMIADLYPPQKRTAAMAVYSAGLNIGLLIAFFGGGFVAQTYGWRVALMLAGVPGLVLTLLVLLTLSEPKRGQVDRLSDDAAAPGVLAALKYLAGVRTFRWMAAGAGFSAFTGYAGLAFNTSFFARSHHLSLVQSGLILSVQMGVFGLAAILGAGAIADARAQSDRRWVLWIPMAGVLVMVPFFPIAYLAHNLAIAIAALTVIVALSTIYMPSCFAAGQSLSPLRIRGKTQAIFLFIVSMVGLGLGPQWVGFASDLLRPALGEDSLRVALTSTGLPLLAGAWCFWQASRSIRADVARAAS